MTSFLPIATQLKSPVNSYMNLIMQINAFKLKLTTVNELFQYSFLGMQDDIGIYNHAARIKAQQYKGMCNKPVEPFATQARASSTSFVASWHKFQDAMLAFILVKSNHRVTFIPIHCYREITFHFRNTCTKATITIKEGSVGCQFPLLSWNLKMINMKSKM